jgi:hypothetical protein
MHLNSIANCIIFNPKKMQVMCVYITGHLNTVFPAEYQKEILRYIYYHQVHNILGKLNLQVN